MTVDDSLKAQLTAAWNARRGGVEGGGGGPHDPGMDPRVAALEADMKDVKASQQRVENTLSRIEETLRHVATKAELAKVEGKIELVDGKVVALDGRVGRVETAINDTVRAAVAKSIGPAQLPAVLGACILVVGALFGGFVWLATKLGFLHV